MAFVGPRSPVLFYSPSRRTTVCSARPPQPSDDALVDDRNGSQYLRSLLQRFNDQLIGSVTTSAAVSSSAQSARGDARDILVDDKTSVDSASSSRIDPAVVGCGQARMAGRPSNDPKPKMNDNAEPTASEPPKRKRGRPKGSKTKKASIPEPPEPPESRQQPTGRYMFRERWRRLGSPGLEDVLRGADDTVSDGSIDWDQVQLHAPNGLPDADNDDLLQELLPILAKQENERNRVIPENERIVKRILSTCAAQFSSTRRFSARLDNLKPFKQRKEAEKVCAACDGSGMTQCEYCNGQGFVDLGKNGEKFNPVFRENVFTMPQHVMGNIYHCPLCGGLQQERCVTCLGTGEVLGTEAALDGASSVPRGNRAWKPFDLDELLKQEADRIEIGRDGTIIMRAKRRGKRKKKKSAEEKVSDENDVPPHLSDISVDAGEVSKFWDEVDEAEAMAREEDPLGRIPVESREVSAGTPAPDAASAPNRVLIRRDRLRRTTDFVNTTDYQVGRRLRKQSLRDFEEKPGTRDAGAGSEQVGEDGGDGTI